MKPKHQHECPFCEYLGTVTVNSETVDAYFCPVNPTGPTIKARHGSGAQNYTAMKPRVWLQQAEECEDPRLHALAQHVARFIRDKQLC